MPTCNCQSYGCSNTKLKPHTFKVHQEEDQLIWRRKAYEQQQKIIQKHDEALASEVAALTLSGNADPGRSLTSNVKVSPSKPSSPSRINPWDELDQIDISLSAVAAGIPISAYDFKRPTSRTEKFPLMDKILQVKSLEARILRVSPSSAQLRIRRQKSSRDAQDLLRRLSDGAELWNRRVDEFGPPESSSLYQTEHHFQAILGGVDPIIQVSLFTMVALHIVLHLSRRGCRFLLSMIRYIVQLTFQHERKSLSDKKTDFVENFAIDPDSATAKFQLEGKETIYAVCPNSKCHKTYAPTYAARSAIPRYPKFCTFKEFQDEEACGTALTRKQQYHETEIQVPIKTYVSFSFKDFVANLLSRPGFEDLMDNPKTSPADGEMVDVHDGQFLRIFTDVHDEPFVSTFDVGRYVFSVCMDFFNPFSNKQAGKKKSIGVISVVCLSLPYTHRYKFENMFLAGVIPGPNEPPLTATNHYLKPLVDDLMEFWEPGVRFSKTHNQPDGRLIYCALIILICDLLAARKAAGLAACTHEHFCPVCHCTRSKSGYGNTSYEKWVRRTDADIRDAASLYKNSSTAKEAQKVFDQYGVRWSELLRLPYFKPTQCVTVDSMHNLFLGLLKEHFMNILGIGLPSEQEQPALVFDLPPIPGDFSTSDDKGVRKLRKLLQAPASISLPEDRDFALSKLTSGITKNALKFICSSIGCTIPAYSLNPTKIAFAEHLLDWRLTQTETREPHADTSTRKGHVLGLTDMEEIWRDLQTILTPSWTNSVPSNLGNPSHGKLKADQWRTLGTLHLPMSLIRIWGTVDPSNARSTRCHQILKVTMLLVSAVTIATSRTSSKRLAEAYLQHMREYLNGIAILFPDYEFRPNHHMALHISEFLTLFGPVQSWWTFPFERLIGALQHMPHNFKIGELEATIARSYTRSANLRGMLTKTGCPEVICKSETLFRKLVDPQLRESLQTDFRGLEDIVDNDDEDISSATRPLSDELASVFRKAGIHAPRDGRFPYQIKIKGLVYSTSTKHSGNSCVTLNDSTPARIQNIVQLSSKPDIWYIVIRRHKPSLLHHNPYKPYSILGAELWSSELGQLEIVSSEDIRCHFASLRYNEDNVVVLPLLRTVSL